jgi:hypothetical protein
MQLGPSPPTILSLSSRPPTSSLGTEPLGDDEAMNVGTKLSKILRFGSPAWRKKKS